MTDLMIVKNTANEVIIRIKSIKQFALINRSLNVGFTKEDKSIKFLYYPNNEYRLTDVNKIVKGIEIRMERR